MDRRTAFRWAVLYRAGATVSFLLGAAIVAAGVWVGFADAFAELSENALEFSDIERAANPIPFGVLATLGVIVWQVGKATAFYYTLGRATEAAGGATGESAEVRTRRTTGPDETGRGGGDRREYAGPDSGSSDRSADRGDRSTRDDRRTDREREDRRTDRDRKDRPTDREREDRRTDRDRDDRPTDRDRGRDRGTGTADAADRTREGGSERGERTDPADRDRRGRAGEDGPRDDHRDRGPDRPREGSGPDGAGPAGGPGVDDTGRAPDARDGDAGRAPDGEDEDGEDGVLGTRVERDPPAEDSGEDDRPDRDYEDRRDRDGEDGSDRDRDDRE